MNTATVRHGVTPAALLVAVLFAATGCSSSATTGAVGQGTNTKAVAAPSSGATGGGALLYGMGGDIYNIYVRKGSTTIDINIATKGGKLFDPETLPPQPVAGVLTTLAKTALGKI